MTTQALSFTQPFTDAFSTLLSFIPQLIGAIVILVIGYFVAKAISKLIVAVLQKLKFDAAMERAGVTGVLERSGTGLTPSSALGTVVFWFVFLIAFTMFASALGVPQISQFIAVMLSYVPRVFAAILILSLAAMFARFLAAIIRGATGNETLAKVGQYAVIVYAVFVVLTLLGIAVQLTGNTLLVVLGGVSLAAGLAFGLGGREMAQDALHRMFRRDKGVAHTVVRPGASESPADPQPGPDEGGSPIG